MMLDVKSEMPFGEVWPPMPKAGVARDRLESLMEGFSVDLPLPLSIGFIRVLQDASMSLSACRERRSA